jgi:nucleoside-diphosphate-sugar epimerase
MEANGGTAFVTGAAGFIGRELVKALIERGVHVLGLARSTEAVQDLVRAGVTVVKGDLLKPGQWQDEAAAHWVFHIPPCILLAARAGWSMRVDRLARVRAEMDRNLLDAVATGATHRIVYVADSSWYGPTGSRPVIEDELQSSDARRFHGPVLDGLDGYVFAGLPIVTALPGCVYGNGSWFRHRIVHPVMVGRRVVQFGNTGPLVSPIHVQDCARALVHLAGHGEVGNRYFAVSDEPVQLNEFARVFARLAHRRLRVWRVPAVAARFVVDRPFADYLKGDAAFSNIRLRGIGFQFRYPTLEQGIEQILEGLHEHRAQQ